MMQGATISEAIGALISAHTDYAPIIERETFDVGDYHPSERDLQKRHALDELYVVAAGRGDFTCGDETRPFAPGDLFFVPAGVDHRFTNFSDDFATWVVFFGERPRIT
jgi:mannose-6-phosphate isomerase-like protein (cupin superfamily)